MELKASVTVQVIQSAMANAENNHGLDRSKMMIGGMITFSTLQSYFCSCRFQADTMDRVQTKAERSCRLK